MLKSPQIQAYYIEVIIYLVLDWAIFMHVLTYFA